MRSIVCWSAILACGLILAGCDGEAFSELDSTPSALVDDNAEVEIEASVVGGDGPSRPVSLTWIDMVPGDTASAGGLALQVKNLSPNDYKVGARLLCNGLINKTADIDLGKRGLSHGETAVFAVDAEEVPIQTTSGAAQARMEITLSRETEAGVSTRRMLTPVVNYRHGAGYQNLLVFDERTLIEQHGGMLSGTGAEITEAGQVLGRVADGVGGFEDVKLMDPGFAVEQDGQVIGWETGMGIAVLSGSNVEEEVVQ